MTDADSSARDEAAPVAAPNAGPLADSTAPHARLTAALPPPTARAGGGNGEDADSDGVARLAATSPRLTLSAAPVEASADEAADDPEEVAITLEPLPVEPVMTEPAMIEPVMHGSPVVEPEIDHRVTVAPPAPPLQSELAALTDLAGQEPVAPPPEPPPPTFITNEERPAEQQITLQRAPYMGRLSMPLPVAPSPPAAPSAMAAPPATPVRPVQEAPFRQAPIRSGPVRPQPARMGPVYSSPVRPAPVWSGPMAPSAPQTQPADPAGASERTGILTSPLVVSDRGMVFAVVAALAWLALVGLPLLLSLAFTQPLDGLPLLGVVVWLIFLRVARRLSPPARADRLLTQGRYAEALASCDASLAVTGEGAWVGLRRLIWLNRRTAALLGLGRHDEALRAALVAMEQSPDPETIATCALALLRLNRYEEAIAAARLVSGATRERSVRANATLAAAMLARGQPAEADALASACLADIEALSPYVRRDSHALCLAALTRARRAQGLLEGPDGALAALTRLRRVAGNERATRAIALLEEAALLDDTRREAWDEAQRLTRQARTLAPGYTLWRLTQPDAPRIAPGDYLAAGLRAQAGRAPAPEAVAALLRRAGMEMAPRPPRLSSSTALLAQIITVGATLALLALWTVMFFVVYAS